MPKVAIITGASGQDAKTLTHQLLEKDYTVILTYRRNTQLSLVDIQNLFINELNKHPKAVLKFESLDITDKNSIDDCIRTVIKNCGQIDEIYLAASQSHNGSSFKQKEYSVLANGMSIYYWLENVKTLTPQTKVVCFSTSELFAGLPNNTIVNEKTPYAPRSPYSIGKALGMHWVSFYRDLGLFVSNVILFNHSNFYRSREFFTRKVTSAAARIVTGKQKELMLGNLDFKKDESNADMICEAIWKSLQQKQPKDYVLGRGSNCHAHEYLYNVFNYFNLKWEDYVKLDSSFLRPLESNTIICDSLLAQKELNWRPDRIKFREHLHLMCLYDFELESGNVPKRPDTLRLYP